MCRRLAEKAAQRFFDRPALITETETVSFASLYARAAALTLFAPKRYQARGSRMPPY